MSKNICSTMQVFHKKYERNLYVSIISGQSRELQDPHSAQERRYLPGAGGFSEKTADRRTGRVMAARQTCYTGLPPAYTFVGDGEPFYAETCTFIENLKHYFAENQK